MVRFWTNCWMWIAMTAFVVATIGCLPYIDYDYVPTGGRVTDRAEIRLAPGGTDLDVDLYISDGAHYHVVATFLFRNPDDSERKTVVEPGRVSLVSNSGTLAPLRIEYFKMKPAESITIEPGGEAKFYVTSYVEYTSPDGEMPEDEVFVVEIEGLRWGDEVLPTLRIPFRRD